MRRRCKLCKLLKSPIDRSSVEKLKISSKIPALQEDRRSEKMEDLKRWKI
jgi:hypothetical protein